MIGYRFFLMFDWLMMALPHSWRKQFFIAVANLAYAVDRKRKRIIRQNLAFAFGDTLDEDTRGETERYCYRNLALNLLQVMENRHLTKEDFQTKITFVNRHYPEELIASGKGAIFISAHYGNWEIGATALSDLITPTTSIYKALDNEAFEPYLIESRSAHKMGMVEKSGALKQLAKALKNNQSISLMIDQSSNERNGVAVNFFNHPTYHTSTPALLSFKYGVPIIPLYILSEDEENYTITFEEPIYVRDDSAEAIKEATQKQASVLEAIIRQHPKFWFWCHKRWKSEYKEIYAG